MNYDTITVNVKKLREGDLIKPNGSGAAKVVARVELLDLEPGFSPSARQVRIHFVGGGSRTENHGKRRTVRRPVA